MQLTDKLKSNFSWFFASLVLFVFVLPFSQALVSISGGVMLFTALAEKNWKDKKESIIKNKILFLTISVFFIYLISFCLFYKPESSPYDLQKSLFYLVIPLAFLIGKPLTGFQLKILLSLFVIAVFGATMVAWFNWFFNAGSANFAVHKITLISHIRFSFQIIFSFWILVLLYQKNRMVLTSKQKYLIISIGLYLLIFLFFQQSLTGLIAFGSSVLFYVFYLLFQSQGKYRLLFMSVLIILVLFPVFYVGMVIYSFYNIEKVSKDSVEKATVYGNQYNHDFNNPTVENGRYVYLYICDDELRAEWNKVSKVSYDSIINTGYALNANLVRYLTSKGLRKDAEGVKSLTDQDIRNIEKGLTNVIYQKNKYSPYPRIYQTVWEYYMYSKTGNPNYQSFSQRIEFAKAALALIKENPWTGVGSGNWKAEFQKTFEKNNPKLEKELYASSHNQYLNYMVKFGIPGFLLIMLLLIYPVIKTNAYSDILFTIFLVFMFVANFADSNFETHMGSSLFLFFYCLFITNRDYNYLVIK